MAVWCRQNLCRNGSSFTWHQPRQCCKYATLVDIQKTRYKKLVIHVESHVSAVSLLESGEQRYKSTSPGSKHQPKPSRHRLLLGHSPLAVCWALGTERRRRRLPQRQHPVALAPPGHQGSPAGVAVCGPASCTAVGAMEHRLKS